MSKFRAFSQLINSQFQNMQMSRNLFTVNIDPDLLYQEYLDAFPPGTNEIFRERREYDCSNCRGFIKNFGIVVQIKDDDSLQTVWDVEGAEYPFDIVASRLSQLVKQHVINDIFHPIQRTFSQEVTRTLTESGELEVYSHFHGVAAPTFVTTSLTNSGEFRTSLQMLKDSFDTLSKASLETVIELIEENQLYRGEEHLSKVKNFLFSMMEYRTSGKNHNLLVQLALNPAISRFKNSVIGTLVDDINGNVPLETAVRSFEQKVAPQNYQRTNQVISKKMVDDAMKTINEMGLVVERRTAQIEDISVNNVLWVDSSTKISMKDGLHSLLESAATSKPVKVKEGKAQTIDIDSFIQSVLPLSTQLRLLTAQNLAPHFVALTTSQGESAAPLFKWDNNFAWSYTGNATDFIKEQVKRAGGQTNALLRFSLSWFNTDDLDLSMIFKPLRGLAEVINFQSRTSSYMRGGLDVDMNIAGDRRDAVENIAFTTLRPGSFEVVVHNYRRREKIDIGFEMQVAYGNSTETYSYPIMLEDKQKALCFTGNISPSGEITVEPTSLMTTSSRASTTEKWGVRFDQFVDVGAVTYSPNFWDDKAVGNKHVFFLLKDAKPDEQLRGLYNEFLHPNLHKIRKVFDVIGERTKPEITPNQLSGIGISSTVKKSLILEVTTPDSKRLYEVHFGEKAPTSQTQEVSYV